MLTRELGIAEVVKGQIIPDQLSRTADAHYIDLASQMCDVYVGGIGKTRRDLHHCIEEVAKKVDDCPPLRTRAFSKLLDDRSQYCKNKPAKMAELRRQVFREAARFQPLVTQADQLFEHTAQEVKQFIASQHGTDWESLKRQMFADLIDNHVLQTFRNFESPMGLLAQYNVAQYQVALFDATQLVVDATSDFRSIYKYAKLAGLLVRIMHRNDGYRFVLDGPSSAIRQTHRYGARMAKFLPGLLSCSDWRMTATMCHRKGLGSRFVELNSRSGLHSEVSPEPEFDSEVEAAFASAWGTERIEGWRLEREARILHDGQKAFFPDFVLSHETGVVVYLEIVGFWTPEYLLDKVSVLRQFKREPIVLAVPRSNKKQNLVEFDFPIIEYSKSLSAQSVLEQVRRWLKPMRP